MPNPNRERAALFVHCQECLIQRRKDVIRRRFIFALSHGANNGNLRPIEMQAHDPVRYVGDILAWVHQAVVSEREFLLTILGSDQQQTSGSSSSSSSTGGGSSNNEEDTESPLDTSDHKVGDRIMVNSLDLWYSCH